MSTNLGNSPSFKNGDLETSLSSTPEATGVPLTLSAQRASSNRCVMNMVVRFLALVSPLLKSER